MHLKCFMCWLVEWDLNLPHRGDISQYIFPANSPFFYSRTYQQVDSASCVSTIFLANSGKSSARHEKPVYRGHLERFDASIPLRVSAFIIILSISSFL